MTRYSYNNNRCNMGMALTTTTNLSFRRGRLGVSVAGACKALLTAYKAGFFTVAVVESAPPPAL